MVQAKRCICQICTCGKHRCPLHPDGGVSLGFKADHEPCSLSEYTNKYQAYPGVSRPSAVKPDPQIARNNSKLDDMTTFRQDYTKHPLETKRVQKPNVYAGPVGEMDLLTSYDKDFPEKVGERAKSMKLVQPYNRDDAKFEGNPTYKDDYKRWDSKPAALLKKDKLYVPPEVQFEGITTNKSDYIDRGLALTKSCKPNSIAMMSAEPFDDTTCNKLNYIPHELPKRFIRTEKAPMVNKEPLDALTTMQKDFKTHALPKVESCKPLDTGVQSSAPLDDTTSYKDDYKKWSLGKREQHVKSPYMKPPGIMDSLTTNKRDFVPHELGRVQCIRPVPQATQSDATFDDATTHKQDYKQWQVKAERRSDPSRRAYEHPAVPFEGMPTYKSHYTEHGLAPVKSYKPSGIVEANNAPFQGETMYHTDYTRKQADMCPVIDLAGRGYNFVDTNPIGHKFYAKAH